MEVLAERQVVISHDQLATLYQVMSEHGDLENAEKMLDLYEKWLKQQFYVSFTGHFSAGKSSIINFLLGKELLPKSPIPTSANIVKITSGKGVARVFFHERQPVEYDEPYDIDVIKDYCMIKDTIKQIEIETKEPIVPKGSYIVDTPGIDAADDADRYMTESSLHLVDVLFYVMDYNHVQSEVNFQFLKQIQEKQIPIYLIINQIDKHNEEELTFSAFKRSVEEAFFNWGIRPERIYYSSIVDESLPDNELYVLKRDLFQLLTEKGSLEKQISHAAHVVVEAHKAHLEKQFEQSALSEADGQFDENRWQEINARLAEMNARKERLEKEFNEEIEATLKNAYVMPAKLRDLAEQFLLSQDAKFKVGFFNAKKKTEQEKEKRLNAFLNDLKQSVQSTIVWKLREKFLQLLHRYEIANETLREEVQQFSLDVTEVIIFGSLKEGATVNGNYVLNYTDEVSYKIKQQAKRLAIELLEKMKAQLDQSLQAEKEILEEEKARLALERQKMLEQSALYAELEAKLANIEQVLESGTADETAHDLVREKLKERKIFVKEKTPTIQTKDETTDDGNGSVKVEASEKRMHAFTKEEIVGKLADTIKLINDLDDFESIIDSLRRMKAKIEHRSLTVALFGAFSAGKSSFSNALLGEKILPVSPNPTTAVINRIRPTTETFGHGTVVITYKTDEVLTNDLSMITKDFAPTCKTTAEFVQWIKRENIHESERLSNVYRSYLKAVLAGYESRGELLGKTEIISLDDFAAYVTDETVAAYIEAVDLYHENELTKNGITLVDTPGANSVNARHTNVAFDYIKDADAIIYVTYYNHAVTSADRDFLVQLGRVKESFALDKMFFVVNASDLAKDDAELKLVVDYVEDQLLNYGIRHAQIYPLSSKQSLYEKRNRLTLNEQMQTFERAFYHFIEHDLHQLTFEAAAWDIYRVKAMLEQIVQSAKLDERERKSQIERLRKNEQQSLELLGNKTVDQLMDRTKERIERQLHYVKERMFIRFQDMFKEHFNPTTVTANGRQATEQLEQNRNRLIDHVGYELLQEVRAVSLRLEAFINQMFNEFYGEVSRELASIDETISLANYEEKRFVTPEYAQAFDDIDVSMFHPALKMFKNLRSFFADNERDKMKDKFYEIMEPEIEAYLNDQEKLMTERYSEQLQAMFQTMLEAIAKEVSLIYRQQINVLNTEIDVVKYSKKLDQMNFILDNLNENES